MLHRFIPIACTVVYGTIWFNSSVASAHFPWLGTDSNGRAIMYFSESVEEMNYHLPDSMMATAIYSQASNGTRTKLDMETIESKEFLGRRSVEAYEGEVLELQQQYGIYHGTLLSYYAKHYRSTDPHCWKAIPRFGQLQLDVVPAWTSKGLQVAVTWRNASLKDAQVTCRQTGQPPLSVTTDGEGLADFPKAIPVPTALTIQHKVAATGEFDGKKFESETHYATVTFDVDKEKIAISQRSFPPLPRPVASFGGTICNNWLYVYGGHHGQAHQHSRENLSEHFCRISLERPSQWELLPISQPLQGLALVGHGSHVFRLGGMQPRNPQGASEDLHSVDTFERFDPSTTTWSKMPSLPEARSSHDAVVINDSIYVAGGWQLAGTSPGSWLGTAWYFPLHDPSGTWKKLPGPPFRRRAVALTHWQNRLVVLGGMDENDKVSGRVDQLDLASGQWSALPELPGDGMDGFGVSAWNVNGTVYVCGTDGILYRLADDASSWIDCNTLQEPRFFHRLLPLTGDSLIAVAGTSMHNGHLSNIEVVKLERNLSR